MFLLGFPLLIIPLIAYNVLVYLIPVDWAVEIAQVPLLSEITWHITASDALFAAALLLLLLEVFKAARPGRRGIVEHILSLMVFGAGLAQFLLVPEAGNSLFAFLVLICFIDTVAGLIISIRTSDGRRRRGREAEDDYLVDYPQEDQLERRNAV